MTIVAIIIIPILITILWIAVYFHHLPIFDKYTKQYVIDEKGINVANLCIFLIIVLSFALGKLV
jgi:hypothetical protein